MRRVLSDAAHAAGAGVIGKEFIDQYVDKILVTPEDGALRLEIKIFTGESATKYLARLRAQIARDADGGQDDRLGHTFKKMIQAYENNMK